MLLGFDIVLAACIVGGILAAQSKPGQKIVEKAVRAVLVKEGVLTKLAALEGKIQEKHLEHVLVREPTQDAHADALDDLRHQQALEIERAKLTRIKANAKLVKEQAKKKLADGDFEPITATFKALEDTDPPKELPPANPTFPVTNREQVRSGYFDPQGGAPDIDMMQRMGYPPDALQSAQQYQAQHHYGVSISNAHRLSGGYHPGY